MHIGQTSPRRLKKIPQTLPSQVCLLLEPPSCFLQVARQICLQAFYFLGPRIRPIVNVWAFGKPGCVATRFTVLAACLKCLEKAFESNFSEGDPTTNFPAKFPPVRSHTYQERCSAGSGHSLKWGNCRDFSRNQRLWLEKRPREVWRVVCLGGWGRG